MSSPVSRRLTASSKYVLLLVVLDGLLHLALCFHICEMGSTVLENLESCCKTELVRRKAVSRAPGTR